MADDINSGEKEAAPSMPCLARVISHVDSTYMGRLKVEILRPVGNDSEENPSETQVVNMMSPFFGSTPLDDTGEGDDNYNNTQKSYGMWFVPPDVGTLVLVIFVNGDEARGYWVGCVPDEFVNFMVPGIAATRYSTDGDGSARVPVAEYNKKILNPVENTETKQKKPRHPFADTLADQGLLLDDIRGITTSSARREIPSAVFGVSTPGPVDKRANAKTVSRGQGDEKISKIFASRLGGSSLVMDDGDDKFLRKTSAGEGPPEYASVVNNESDGDATIPHNELFRIRTRTGHQILLHNSEDLIYIGNSRGTTWIELTSNGKIDIYSQDSVSVHSGNDINFTADRDINFTAGNNINLNAATDMNITATANLNLKADAAGKISTNTLDISSTTTNIVGSDVSIGGSSIVLAAGKIDLNGPAANAASPADIAPVTYRRPQAEPWDGHENLSPASHAPSATGAVPPEDGGKTPVELPKYFKEYTTSSDPFDRIAPTPEEE